MNSSLRPLTWPGASETLRCRRGWPPTDSFRTTVGLRSAVIFQLREQMPAVRLGGVALQGQAGNSAVLNRLVAADEAHQKLRMIAAAVAGFPGLPQLLQIAALCCSSSIPGPM